MNESEKPETPETPSSESEAAPRKKRPYEKPSFRCQQVFVTTALSCGKVGGTGGSCTISAKS
jgi:hypothetical protein